MPSECKHVTFITSVKMIILILAVCTSLGQSEVNVDCIWNSDRETTLLNFYSRISRSHNVTLCK